MEEASTREPPRSLKDAVNQEKVRRFYAKGGFGNDRLRHLLEALHPVRKKTRDQIESLNRSASTLKHDAAPA